MYETAFNTNLNAYCQYRLPCGYCEKLGRDCPKQSYNYINPVTVTTTTQDAPATQAITSETKLT